MISKLKGFKKEPNGAETQKLMTGMSNELINARKAINELLDENQKLKNELQTLKNKEQNPLLFKKGAYFTENGDGPFCPQCYDSNNKQIRLTKISTRMANYYCPTCKAPYKLKIMQ
jgi:hypothetical protein